MSHFALLILLVAILSVVLPTLYRLLRSGPREAKTVVEYAQKKGYVLLNPELAHVVDMSPLEMMRDPALANLKRAALDISNIEKLDGGTGDWLAFTCNFRSKEMTIFNLVMTSRRSDASGGNIHYKVAKIKAAGLPRFSLGRKSAMHTFEDAVEKLAHLSQPEIHVDARQYSNFEAQFWIKGSDPAAVTAFLSDDKIRFLEASKPEGTLATNANYLVYFEGGKLVTEQDFDSFIAKAEAIAVTFL